jgi:hypothetical protein
MAIFDLPGERKTCVMPYRRVGGILMRRSICGAVLVFAGLGLTCASAEDAAKWQDHSSAGGGWTMGSGVGGWKQNSTTKTLSNTSSGAGSSSTTTDAFGRTTAFTSVAAGGVSSSTSNEAASNAAAGAVSSTATTLLGPRPSPLQSLGNDSGCVFVAQDTPAGNRWRPGCK